MQENDPPSSLYELRPAAPPAEPWWKKILAPLGIAGVLILKFAAKIKFLILPLIKFLPLILKTGGTMVLSMWVYAMMWGWKYAVGFVLLIFLHEGGHLIAARMVGLKVGAPVFIPFMGASIALKEAPANAWIEAFVGIGGPVAGAAASAACQFIYAGTGEPIWAALAYSGYFLNLFNLIPISPLDGGRVATAISPWLWLPGLGVFLWLMLSRPFGPFSFVFIVILISAIPRVISLFRHRDEASQRYFELTPQQRLTMAFTYFALIGLLALGMHEMTESLRASGHYRS